MAGARCDPLRKIHGATHRPWLTALPARRPTKVAAIALANKLARMAWAMMARGERYLSRLRRERDHAGHPAFGYGAPHPSAGGTSTLPIWALPSAHYGGV
jgi:hypothetical protein